MREGCIPFRRRSFWNADSPGCAGLDLTLLRQRPPISVFGEHQWRSSALSLLFHLCTTLHGLQPVFLLQIAFYSLSAAFTALNSESG